MRFVPFAMRQIVAEKDDILLTGEHAAGVVLERGNSNLWGKQQEAHTHTQAMECTNE